jgi:hypothetical protein
MTNAVPSRDAVEAALQRAIDAVDTLFAVRETHSGNVHVPLILGHESAIARVLLPRLSGTHLGRLVKQYGREFISDYAPPKRAA